MDTLAAIICTAEKKSVTRAGTELGLSPSAITKRIKSAERITETKLFMTTEEGLILTEAGELCYGEAIKSLEHALLAEEKIAAYQMLKARHILVGHSTYLPPRFMGILIQFRFDADPPVHIEHRGGLTSAIAQQVIDGTLHAGFGYLPQVHPDLHVEQLFEEPLVVCMPSSHSLAAKHVIDPRDFNHEPFIAVSREQLPLLHEEIDDYFQGFGIHLNIVADAFDSPEAIAYVEQKMGVCLLASSSIHLRPGIVTKPLTHRILTRKSGMFIRADNRNELLHEFTDLILKRTEHLRRRP